MTSALGRFDGAPTQSASAASFALGAAGSSGHAVLESEHGVAVALYGAPLISDPELAAAMERDGAAAALGAAYARDGAGFLRALGGPFALALVLPDPSRLLLATDRVGIAPVYIQRDPDGVRFASALCALSEMPGFDRSLDAQSLYHYLYFHVIPAPRSAFRGVSRLCPGEYLEVDGDDCRTGTYWAVEYARERERLSFVDLKDEFRSLMGECVREEVAAGGEVGCFLSGGTDSSTVAGYLGQVTGAPARTYSIGFEQQGYDEMSFARIAARHFSTDHHEYYVTPDDIVELVPRVPQIYGEPFGNSSVVPTYYCARMAREDGVDVLLGGDGGDELFAGNERYARQLVFALYERVPERLRRSGLEPLLGVFPFGDRILPVRKARRYVEQANMPMPDRLESYNLVDWFGVDVLLDTEFARAVTPQAPSHP